MQSPPNPIKPIARLLSMLCLLWVPIRAPAQWSFDVLSVEAYINDHKQQRSLLLARATLEESNKLLHVISRKETASYDSLNIDLDKYTRAFDVIDLLYQGLRTSLNLYDTYEDVSECLEDYAELLSDYTEVVEARGMSLADVRLLEITDRTISNLTADCEALYASLCDLVLYTTGAAACTTADLLSVCYELNECLDDIGHHLRQGYVQTWKYIEVRKGYWKESVYVSKSKAEIAAEALSRWKSSGH